MGRHRAQRTGHEGVRGGASSLPPGLRGALREQGVSLGERLSTPTTGEPATSPGTYRAVDAAGRDVVVCLAREATVSSLPAAGADSPPAPRRRRGRRRRLRGRADTAGARGTQGDLAAPGVAGPASRAGQGGLSARAAVLAAVRHPALPPVRQVLALPPGWVAITTDLVAGVELGAAVATHGFLTRAETAQVVSDVAGGLAALHAAGIVHGDVCPDNVIVTPQGRCVLIDLLGSGQQAGTPGWASPEVSAGGGQVGAAADVYSLAALARTCVEGSDLLAAETAPLVADALAHDPRRRPSLSALVAALREPAGTTPLEVGEELARSGTALWQAARRPTAVRPPRQRAYEPRRRRRSAAGAHALPSGAGAWAQSTRAVSTRVSSRAGGAGRRGGRRRTAARGPRPPGGGMLAGALRTGLVVAVLVSGVLTGHSLLGQGTARSALPGEQAPSGSPSAPAPRAPSGAVEPAAVSTRVPTSPASAPAGATAQAPRADAPGGPQEAVRRLQEERDRALQAQDATALAALSVPGSPAAAQDAQVLEMLIRAGERVEGLRTQVLEPTVVADGSSPGAQRVRVRARLRQLEHVRVAADGTRRRVPAQSEHVVVIVLVPGPWRVEEVLADQPEAGRDG